jgi:hypothetical protein
VGGASQGSPNDDVAWRRTSLDPVAGGADPWPVNAAGGEPFAACRMAVEYSP